MAFESMTALAYVFLVFAMLFAIAAAFLPWFIPVDREDMNDEEPTLNTRGKDR
jgi:hypothetical protein